ncbi:hypothetical protein [Streptomyces sp. NBC_01006]|uniref:hypothetical protein n=1 Tax=Streptomyces sp. NBC_01006 TaxID=2903716 RepID=UPI00386A2A8B|nr:hypothetical protein OG509_32910 [Streptomyces sp. NBC_01006]
MVLYYLDAVPVSQELGLAVTDAQVWLEQMEPADPSCPAPAFLKALENTVRITGNLLARHSVAATYVHLDTEQPPWDEHQRLEAASAPHCRHIAIRRHDVATHGWPVDQRPEFARLRRDVEEGRVHLLVVRSASDLSPSGHHLDDQPGQAKEIRRWLHRHRARLLCVDQIAHSSNTT